MAEILGIVAGVTGIVDVGIRVSGRLHKIAKVWKHAPDEILALSREVSDFTAVMHSVEDACRSIQLAPSASTRLASTLGDNIMKAAELIRDIDDAIQELASLPKLKQRSKWLSLRTTLEQKIKALHGFRVHVGHLLRAQGM
ncbi:hypothetical protein N658DRAFT_510730 [Parathielavia hyrcaniae]|uniref:Uncharacterized protein n=1 Tax=Parathielavia hyrcaniae TaxID=113614 RepID=A0AAN6PX87_9PEZI|nr:hypothetical protein N658DRAFT_510730 [Parathielavia hyrcaniae]